MGEPTARSARDIARLMGVTVDFLGDDLRAEPEEVPALTDAETVALKTVRSLEVNAGSG